jgi:hypothetical protein
MFGLLNLCKPCQEGYKSFRQNYCGTCKTIGTLYGQKERCFLNNDIVFLSELLAEINNYEDEFKYMKMGFCFKLPNDNEQIPKFLRFTASVNILLGYYKILDNIVDSKYKVNLWQIIKLLETPNFLKSKRYLESIEFPTEYIESLIEQQFIREAEKKQFNFFQETLRYYSEITGKITGEVFRQGAMVLEKKSLSDLLFLIGQKFGEIVYLVDAVSDFKKDLKHNAFNLFLLTDSGFSDRIASFEETFALNYINSALAIIQNSINLLPISEKKKTIFNSRLFTSISKIINKNPKIKKVHCDFKQGITLKNRYVYAIQTAKYIYQKRGNIVLKNTFFIPLSIFLLIVFLLIPNLIHANGLIEIQEHTCCGKCCAGCCTGCCKCCGCSKCCGPSETNCCYETGDDFQNTFCNWPGCLGLLCIGPAIWYIPALFFGDGEGDDKPNIIVIIKEKGCGC